MFANSKTWAKRFLRNEKGVTAIEYCIASAFIGATIIGSLSAIGPSIGQHMGNAMKPNAGVLQYDCMANGGSGNCGVGQGLDSGNGTPNEGQGKGPGA